MNNQSVIRKFLAFVMLVLFTFSITPKNYWGKCLADHGGYAGAVEGKMTVIRTGFDCHCDELVVSTPFTETASDLQFLFSGIYKEFNPLPYHFTFLTTLSAKDSRGPPAVA